MERQGSLRLFLLPPDGSRPWSRAKDNPFWPTTSSDAARRGDAIVRLSRTEAGELGLPPRAAFVGLATINRGPLAGWTLAVAATALRERDRDRWAQQRSILSVLTATALLLAFGVVALRNQRKELELERELALAALRDEQNERLASATRAAALGTLAIGVAHEVSTPLGVIAGRAEQLLPKVRTTSGDMRRSRPSSTRRIGSVRSSAAFWGWRGAIASRRTICQPNASWRAPELSWNIGSTRPGFALSIDVPAGLPTVTGDARLIESALVNLLLNACDACAIGGHVRLSVEAHESAVRFSVVDDGSGISVQHAEKVLEPFFTTKASGEGTGLGLAITNEIVKSHFGTLSLTPQISEGNQRRRGDPGRRKERRRMNRPRPRILVADDNVEMARTTADGLAEHGYDTVIAAGGQEALDRLAAEHFDAVVTDLRMPGIDGLALLAASRRIDPGRPVIVMTAYSAIDSAIESIRQGAYHYLTKPFKLDELRIFLSRALEDYRLRHEASALRKTLKQRFSSANLIGDTAGHSRRHRRHRTGRRCRRSGLDYRRNRNRQRSWSHAPSTPRAAGAARPSFR